MALADIAMFLYGFDVSAANRYIDFKNVFGGSVLTAVMNLGNYTATEYMQEVKRALELADGVNTYTITMNRTINGGTENRIRIQTSGSFLSLLFGTGTSAASSAAPLMGFSLTDYTGSTLYTGSVTAGTALVPDMPTWSYLGPDDLFTNDGVKNITANGIKETLVFAQMPFLQGEWRFITDSNGRTQQTQWRRFMKYATRQLKFEITPDIRFPTVFYGVTLETTPDDGNGMGFKFQQMTDVGLYKFYKTGLLKFRVNIF